MKGFALIALAKYCRDEDLETIREGFSLDVDYLAGYFVFFKAIENCPNAVFKSDVLSSTRPTDENYIRALAAFNDPDCLRLLEAITHDSVSLRSDEWPAIVYYALKKHYHPMCDELIAMLEKRIGKDESLWKWYNRSRSRWNY
jgi:hypothetical protein